MSPNPQIVNVTRNGTELSLDHPQIDLSPGNSVEWKFQGLDSQEMGFIQFQEPFGPFQSLLFSGPAVVGVGNSGNADEFAYTALVLNQNGQVATSDGINASISNPSNVVQDTSPNAVITYNPVADPPLQITPPTLTVPLEGTAIWYVEGLPDDHSVTFQFDSIGENPLLGPFLFFSVSQGFATARVAVGMGLLSALLKMEPNPDTRAQSIIKSACGTR